jgi:hypothetical protein
MHGVAPEWCCGSFVMMECAARWKKGGNYKAIVARKWRVNFLSGYENQFASGIWS